MLLRFSMFIILLIVAAPITAQQLDMCPGHLVTVEPEGSISSGSKQKLLTAVRSGIPLRVGWSLDFNNDKKPELAHWADAIFITEFEGEIFTQITEITRQAPLRGKKRIDLGEKSQRWTGLIGTNGFLEGRFNDDQPATQIPVRSRWCVDPRVPRSEWPSETAENQPSANLTAQDCCSSTWRLVYHHNNKGVPINGSKDELFDAIRRGYPIRLAWGSATKKDELEISVEHAAEPVFLTIMNGSELAVQLPEHIIQTSYWNAEEAKFDKAQVMWRGLLGTTGEFDAVLVDRATGKTVRRIPQQAHIAWYVFSPHRNCESSSSPVLAVPQGVTLKE